MVLFLLPPTTKLLRFSISTSDSTYPFPSIHALVFMLFSWNVVSKPIGEFKVDIIFVAGQCGLNGRILLFLEKYNKIPNIARHAFALSMLYFYICTYKIIEWAKKIDPYLRIKKQFSWLENKEFLSSFIWYLTTSYRTATVVIYNFLIIHQSQR